MMRLRAVLLAAIMLVPAVAGADRWIQCRSENFEIYSAAPKEDAQVMLAELELFHAALRAFFGQPPVERIRVRVVAFGFESDMKPFLPKRNGKTVNATAIYSGQPDGSVIMFATDQPMHLVRPVIYHEVTHMFFHSLGLKLPLWLNEGLAEFYSSFEVKRSQVEFGRDKPEHRQFLSRYPAPGLRWMFGVNKSSPDYNEGLRQGMFYAQSWIVLHYWMCGPDRSNYEKFLRFLALSERDDLGPAAAFEMAFGVSIPAMERHLKAFVEGGRYQIMRMPRPPGREPGDLAFRPVGKYERDAMLENLRVRMQAPADSEDRLRLLAERAPESPWPHETWGALAMMRDDDRLAQEQWRQAADLGSQNPFIYVQCAKQEFLQGAIDAPFEMRLPAERSGRARKWLREAIRLDPDYLLAYELLAILESVAEQPSVAAANLAQSVLSRQREPQRTLIALAVIRWRLGDHETARRMVAVLLDAPQTPEPFRRAATQLGELLDDAAKGRKERDG